MTNTKLLKCMATTISWFSCDWNCDCIGVTRSGKWCLSKMIVILHFKLTTKIYGAWWASGYLIVTYFNSDRTQEGCESQHIWTNWQRKTVSGPKYKKRKRKRTYIMMIQSTSFQDLAVCFLPNTWKSYIYDF